MATLVADWVVPAARYGFGGKENAGSLDENANQLMSSSAPILTIKSPAYAQTTKRSYETQSLTIGLFVELKDSGAKTQVRLIGLSGSSARAVNASYRGIKRANSELSRAKEPKPNGASPRRSG